MARRSSQQRGHRRRLAPAARAAARRAGASARAPRRRRTGRGTARSRAAPAARPGARRWRPHHAFGDVEPDQQAHPAIGVHAVLQQAGQRQHQRQHLERQRAAAGAAPATAPRPRPSTISPSTPPTASARVAATRRARSGAAGRRPSSGMIASHDAHDSSAVTRPLAGRALARRCAAVAVARRRCSTLRERFREDRLGLTASSLTFTTADLAGAALHGDAGAVHRLPDVRAACRPPAEATSCRAWCPTTSPPVLGALTQFATKASRLGIVGLVALVFTAMALMLTIDRTLNAIWRVRKPRAARAARADLLGRHHARAADPGASLTLDVVRDLGVARPGAASCRGGVGFCCRHRRVRSRWSRRQPRCTTTCRNTPRGAGATRSAGGLFVAAGIEIAKRALALYLGARADLLDASTAPSRPCRSSWCGSTSAGSSCCSAP